MSASSNKTVWTWALVGVLIFLTWKLWPEIKKTLASKAGAAGAGGAGGAAGAAGQPYSASKNPSQSNPFAGSNLPSGSGSQPATSFINWVDSMAHSPASEQYMEQSLLDSQTAEYDELPQSIDTVPLQNFDVNQMASDLPTDDSEIYDNSGDESQINDYSDVPVDTGGEDTAGDYSAGDDGGY